MVIRALLLLAGLLAAAPAASSEPAPAVDEGRPAPIGRNPGRLLAPRSAGAEPAGRIPRAVEGGPGYVGSDYGLGKPAFTGLGSRPDWGRSGY